MYSCGSLHMDEQRQDVLLEPTYSSSVSIRDVALRICREQWTIGGCGERGSEMSVLIERQDDDDIYICISISLYEARRSSFFKNWFSRYGFALSLSFLSISFGVWLSWLFITFFTNWIFFFFCLSCVFTNVP